MNIAAILAENNIPADKLDLITQIVALVKNTHLAEQIILFGSYARGNFFLHEKRTKQKSDFDFLVIVEDEAKQKQIQSQLIDAFNHFPLKVDMIFETAEFIQKSLSRQQYFYTEIFEEGKLLFDSKKLQFKVTQKLTPALRKEIAQKNFKNKFKDVETFFKVAKFNVDEGDIRHASFNLQQTVEIAYKTIDVVFKNKFPKYHGLLVLQERAVKLAPEIAAAFPIKTAEQKEDLKYLSDCYVCSRYEDPDVHPITAEQVAYWTQQAQLLIELTKKICLARIEKGFE